MRLRELFEAAQKRVAVVAFGRMNPPTIGHEKLVETIKSIGGDHYLFLSQSQKPKTDPLAFADKLRYAKFFFPELTIGHPDVRTPMDMMVMLQNLGYTDIIYVAGSDRVEGFTKLFNDYNGKPDKSGNIGYQFNSIEVVSAGERDPDADGAEGMSASKMRAAAAAGNLEEFTQGVPRPEVADEMFAAVRKGMGIKDEVPAESIVEADNDLEAQLTDIRKQMHDIQNKYPEIGTKFAVWGVSDGIPLCKEFMSDEDFDNWLALGKQSDEIRSEIYKARMSRKPAPRQARDPWGDNRGYGQGRYMGDSIEESETAPETIKPMQIPQFPPMPTQAGDLGDGSIATQTKQGMTLGNAEGVFLWDASGKPAKWKAPNFGGMSQTYDLKTGDITVTLNNNGLKVTKVYDKTGKLKQGQDQMSYDMGTATVNKGPQGTTMTTRGATPDQDVTTTVQ